MKAIVILCISLAAASGGRSALSQDRAGTASLYVSAAPLREALDTLMHRYGVAVIYRDSDIDTRLVSLSCRACTVEEVLTQLLISTDLQWERRGRQYIIIRRSDTVPPLRGTVWGFVADSVSGQPLPEANVLLFADGTAASAGRPLRWCTTNRFGFFSLPAVGAGPQMIIVRSVGYRSHAVPIVVSAGVPVRQNVCLAPDEIELREVVVEGRRASVVPLADLSSGIYIQGAPSDQDLTLLDGMPIFNPEHIGGMLYAFAPEAMQEVRLRERDLPPAYGERIGGILDVTLREGDGDGLGGSAGVGFVNSFLTLEGPAGRTGTFIVSGRRVYPDVFVGRLTSRPRNSLLNYSDALAKISVDLSPADRLQVSGYLSRDVYARQAGSEAGTVQNDLRWGNSAVSVRWAHVLSHAAFATTSLVHSRYALDASQRWSGPPARGDTAGFLDVPGSARISETGLSTHVQYVHDGQHALSGGLTVSLYDVTANVSQFSSQTAAIQMQEVRPVELSGHLEHEWRIGSDVTSRLGFRTTVFNADGGSFVSFDPRLSAELRATESLTIFSSFAAVTQFLHPYNQGGLFLFFPVNVWYPSTGRIRPSRSLQLAIGSEVVLPGRDNHLTARLYYRLTEDLHEFIFLPLSAGPSTGEHDFRDALITGRGVSQGLSLGWRSRGERWEGLVSYDLSWTLHRFSELNNGESFAPRLDRRHELTVGFAHALAAGWQLRGSWVYASNQSPSFSTRVDEARGFVDHRGGVDVETSFASPGFIAVNGNRIPGFQRLDIALTYESSALGFPLQLSLRVHNAYAVLDPFSWGLRDTSDPRLRWWVDVDPPGLFPLFPSLDVGIRF